MLTKMRFYDQKIYNQLMSKSRRLKANLYHKCLVKINLKNIIGKMSFNKKSVFIGVVGFLQEK